MKKTLIEEISRVQTLLYGKSVLSEDFLSDLNKGKDQEGQKVDDVKTADFVSNNVQDFYETLSDIDYPIFQQQYGNMQYQKNVESVQMGLLLLGYQLPKHGVDGLFGPETAIAVNKFKQDNNIKDNQEINEAALIEPVPITKVTSPFGTQRSYETHPGVDLRASSGTQVKSPGDGIVLKAGQTNGSCGGSVTIKHGEHFQSRYCHLKQINVTAGQQLKQGDPIGLSGGAQNDSGRGNSHAAHLHFELKKDGVLVNPMNFIGKGGYDFTTTSTDQQTGTAQQTQEAIITPQMVDIMLSKLKQKNLQPKDLDPFVDKAVKSGGGNLFTDLDLSDYDGLKKYAYICQQFIERRQSNPLGITGDMMAKAAQSVYVNTPNKYVPPELALAQLALEGGVGAQPNARPVKTKNPFNVGNTSKSSKTFTTVQDGINAYYRLIATNYLSRGKTATDLIQNFVNKNNQSYVGSNDGNYERQLVAIAKQANKIGQSIA
jgi:murein DD-endopeptidase MepM/ murein hydrolase activator NlpD